MCFSSNKLCTRENAPMELRRSKTFISDCDFSKSMLITNDFLYTARQMGFFLWLWALKRPNRLSFDHFPALTNKVAHAEKRLRRSSARAILLFPTGIFSKSMVISLLLCFITEREQFCYVIKTYVFSPNFQHFKRVHPGVFTLSKSGEIIQFWRNITKICAKFSVSASWLHTKKIKKS